MATETTNYNLKKPALTDPVDVTVLNGNADIIDNTFKDHSDKLGILSNSSIPYNITTGSANTYAVTLDPAPTTYTDGMAIAVKINVENTGSSTINVNGLGNIPIKKSNGNDVASGFLKANTPYTLRYNGTNFILQGEGGSGNALASDLLSGKTASTDAGDIVGTIPIIVGGNTIIPGTSNQTAISAGNYVASDITVSGDPNLVSSNIISGASIFGVNGTASTGTNTSDATATASQILSGQTAYISTGKVTGSMPNKVGSASIITPSTSDIAITQGYYGGALADGKVKGDANLIATNILSGKSIFGVAGNVSQKLYASGSIGGSAFGQTLTVNLSFSPSAVHLNATITYSGGTTYYDYPYSFKSPSLTSLTQWRSGSSADKTACNITVNGNSFTFTVPTINGMTFVSFSCNWDAYL